MKNEAPRRVGVVGAGRIVRTGHLPAYAAGGVPVTAMCSSSRATAAALADAFPGLKVRIHDTAAEVAADPDVDVIDVATRPDDRLQVIRELLPFGKPLLVQKPLAYTLEEALAIAREAAEAGVPLAVNHNLRWAPPQRLLLDWARSGRLGDIAHLAHVHHFSEDIRAWYIDHPDYLFLDHGLHYLDLARQLAGEPVAVSARARILPGQTALSPLTYTITATLHTATTSETFSPSGEWVPDGILGAYRAFAQALDSDTVPEHDVTDHLRSLALAVAAATSAAENGAWTNVPASEGALR
ncbi:Gfo/Idh/MocA family protein [Microtetraspora niveoalba]|uniref:Gfo/Idh/MocA family protein n=1 Tax=Microtetraspora niveoalba TaxID=46175 RepID=UPI00082A4790|nr:Gfo/Idh/MocA family oxidoreductase [Microtetraspora niveoalba]